MAIKVGSKMRGEDPREQYRIEKRRAAKRLEEKPLDFIKQKELVKKGIQKILS